MSSSSQSFTKPSPSLPAGTGEDYWSMDDYISSQERIPSRVEQPLYRLGFLSPHSKEEHLLPGAKIDLPLWLARTLCTRRRQVVSVLYPKVYREAMRTALAADPTVIDLHRNGPYYYSVGVSLLHFNLKESENLARTLIETFVRRFRGIMDSSHHSYSTNTTALTSQLDELEKYLFNLGQEALTRQVDWERGHSKLIGASSLVDLNSRKRKRDEAYLN